MSDSKPNVGAISWFDLTVEDADRVRQFYEKVVGWSSRAVDMGGYSDFNMHVPGGDAVAGVCHARGANADLPPMWMIYVTVSDLTASIDACEREGGQVVSQPRSAGGGQFAVVRDPAGACLALYQPG